MKEKRILERYNALKLGWLRDSLFFIAAVAVVFVMFRFVIGLSVVGGASMDPTLSTNRDTLFPASRHQLPEQNRVYTEQSLRELLS